MKTYGIKNYNPEDLLQSGLDHLSSASILLGTHPDNFDSAGYLAHMGLELLLKSWILNEKLEFKGTHSLKDLMSEVTKLNPKFTLTDRDQKTVNYISNFVELRYPSKTDPVEVGQEDIAQIEELAEKIWGSLPDTLIQAFEKIPVGKKGSRILMKRPKNIPRDLALETEISHFKSE